MINSKAMVRLNRRPRTRRKTTRRQKTMRPRTIADVLSLFSKSNLGAVDIRQTDQLKDLWRGNGESNGWPTQHWRMGARQRWNNIVELDHGRLVVVSRRK